MDKSKKKEYTNGELTVVWQADKCIHAAVCVHTLPDVYDPKGRPWIKPENASTEELKKQIDQCPSGALSYYMNNTTDDSSTNMQETKVQVLKDGPLLVNGKIEVMKANGQTEIQEKSTAFCRCGHSANKPYCDGKHKQAGFKD